ncbi:sulfotransferase family cytosolic 1B member 1-like [Pollicipes pollicipes]|uniref:sulfotransferase family cytosolic 1B member 1-like n=1 Tax=Pollicipes pollicipes TaxID=41117 RepID=UPI001885867C|nr:sulfotransferase family cytosolic 1B member 1-like [Pollicipes pollicipes]
MATVSTTDEETARREQHAKAMAAKLAQMKVPDDWKILPADPNYKNPLVRHFRHRGTVLTNYHLVNGCVEHWARFQARPTDIFVASFPKSGTTWLQEIVWRIVHGETGAGGKADTPLEYRFPLLDMPSAVNMEMRSVHEMDDPRLIKTHLTYDLLPPSVHTSGTKVLYVTRDPRDVCVSYYHCTRMVNYEKYRGTFPELRDRFVRGEVMHAPYREHVQGYLRHADTVLCVTYEQLHADRAAVVRRVATFLGRPATDDQVESIVSHTSFGAMKENPGTNFRHWEKKGLVTAGQEGTFMRKGQVGDWRNYFTEEEGDAFLKWANEPV